MIEITGTFISGILGVGAAVMGAGYWALVIQAVSLEAIYLFLILYINGLPDLRGQPPRPAACGRSAPG